MPNDDLTVAERETRSRPGPWYVGAQNDQLYITSGLRPAQSNDYPDHEADRTPIAKVYGEYPVSDANARLIAAAPELLEALMDAEQFLDDLIRAPKIKYDRAKLLNQFRAALAKAEGK